MEVATKLMLFATLGCFLIGFGGVMKPIMEAIFPPILAKQLEIKPGSFVYDTWKEVEIPVYMEFYTMGIGNPQEFLQGSPPYVVQKGPYTYREYRPKENVTHYDNYTVSYYQMKSYVFDEDLSVGPDSEKFMTLNLAVFTIAHWLKDLPDGIQDLWKLVHQLSGAEPLMELSIAELMWGYDDPYLVLAQQILGEDRVPSTKFGLFLNVNNTDDGLWNVFTGVDDINKVAKIDTWDGMSSLTWWNSEWANMINGSDGSQQHPYIKKSELLYNFVPVACRSGYGVFEKETRIADTPTWSFVAPPDMFASPDINPDNIGFCVSNNNTCPPGGLIDGSPCYFNAPVYLSMPHFLYGDESLFEMCHGLSPNKEEHQIVFNVDPLSGLTFNGHLRAQMSLRVQAYDYIDGTQFINEAYLPVVWLNETYTIPQHEADLYKKNINLATYLTLTIMCVTIFGGIGILFGVLISWYRNRKLSEEQLPFNSNKPHISKSGHEEVDIYEKATL
ncbi:platelet glycoprotein 4-like [Amphiura filiformis]|uniref:platelet glycoprotein 4-like n=1 Tax=Amphiura filiformis TaxID=82378 RepID=UPI003B20F2BF